MITLKCSKCGGCRLTTNSEYDVKCEDCGRQGYAENFALNNIDYMYMVFESDFNTDKPRALDTSPKIHLVTTDYKKAKDKLREVSAKFEMEEWDMEDLESYDQFTSQIGYTHILCSIEKIKLS